MTNTNATSRMVLEVKEPLLAALIPYPPIPQRFSRHGARC